MQEALSILTLASFLFMLLPKSPTAQYFWSIIPASTGAVYSIIHLTH